MNIQICSLFFHVDLKFIWQIILEYSNELYLDAIVCAICWPHSTRTAPGVLMTIWFETMRALPRFVCVLVLVSLCVAAMSLSPLMLSLFIYLLIVCRFQCLF